MVMDSVVSLAHTPEVIEKVGTPLTVRPDLRVVDCTIRDGGLVNNFGFTDEIVRALYRALGDAGVDYMEIGYKASKKIFSPDRYGKWKFGNEADIRRVLEEQGPGPKISVMADAERTDYQTDILKKTDSAIDMIRVATYVNQLATAIDMIKDAHDKGYETCINIMAASTVHESDLDAALEILAQTEVDVIYLVDSFGSFYSETTRAMVAQYMRHAKLTGKKLGIHAHNNQQLAFANTLEAMIMGTSYLDTTVYGMGRGAGNCNTELLLGFLKNPRYHVRPLFEVIDKHILPLRKEMHWGFDLPYMMTGQWNMHPKPAMKFFDQPGQSFTEFHDTFMDQE